MMRRGRRSLMGWGLVLVAVASGVVLGTVTVQAQVDIRVDQMWDDLRITSLDFDGDGRMERGDRVAVVGPLIDPATDATVGSVFWDCVVTTRVFRFEARRGATFCTARVRLSGGDILVQGPDPASYGATTFAVTGGTGQYRDASGQADVLDAPNPDRTEITIDLEA